MDIDRALDHVRLERVDGAIVDLIDGLWDARQTALTVLFHPGRVKSGLQAHGQYGSAIVPDQRYRMAVDRTMRRADGKVPEVGVSHAFIGGGPITAPLDLSSLRSVEVRPGTVEPVRIQLDRPWDRLSTDRGVGAVDAEVNLVPVSVRAEGNRIVMHPVGAWHGRHVRLTVQDDVEDVCGNRVDDAFDHRHRALHFIPLFLFLKQPIVSLLSVRPAAPRHTTTTPSMPMPTHG